MKNLVFVVLSLAVLAGLFLWFRPQPLKPVLIQAESNRAAMSEPLSAPLPKLFELVVKDGKLLSGAALIQVQQGEALTLRITSADADELHLHGYDLRLKLPAAQAAELRFVADRSGRFEYELHHAQVSLGVLEVLPR